jgi:hypothetical protein
LRWFRLLRSSQWRLGQHAEPERVLDHRPVRHHHQVPHRGLRRFDLRRLQRLDQQRRQFSAPTVDAEYLSALWNADIESVRRAKSGAVASDVYNNKIVAERSYMQAANTRVVTFEMCGNDGLQARTAFKSQTGTCNYSGMEPPWPTARPTSAAAMDYINANAYGVKLKVISNLFYPGYNADNVQSSCKDATTGATVNLRDKFLPYLARMNYWMCEYARQKGFKCADSFAEFMGADYDSNGDGQVDAEACATCPARPRPTT